MDIVSHVLLGAAVASAATRQPEIIIWFMFYSVFPDIIQLPLYLIIGTRNKRPYFMPYNSDWTKIPLNDPVRIFLYDIPHSFIFLLFIVAPLTIILKLPLFVLAGYALHLVLDLASHKTWLMRPFYPLPTTIKGPTDAWSWNWKKIGIAWISLVFIIFLVFRFFHF